MREAKAPTGRRQEDAPSDPLLEEDTDTLTQDEMDEDDDDDLDDEDDDEA